MLVRRGCVHIPERGPYCRTSRVSEHPGEGTLVPYVAGVSTPQRGDVSAVRRWCRHTPEGAPSCRTSWVSALPREGTLVPYVVGVSTPVPSDSCVVNVRSPTPFQEAESFSYTPYVVGLPTPILLHGCVDTHVVFRVSFKATYGEGSVQN